MSTPSVMHGWYRRGPFRGRWIAPNRRERVRLWCYYAIEKWDDMTYRKRWPDRYYAPEWGVLDRIFRVTCWVVGHRPTVDHCCRPEHDYCEVCNAATPGQAPRSNDRPAPDLSDAPTPPAAPPTPTRPVRPAETPTAAFPGHQEETT